MNQIKWFALFPFLILAGEPCLAQPGFDVNDVTILFPLDKANAPYPQIRLDDGKLISTENFAKGIHQVSQPMPPETVSPENWRIVGLRLDPCFPADASGTCVKQVRLIGQFVDKKFGPSDQAVHLLYRLNDADFSQATRTLRQIWQLSQNGLLTRGKSLRPHPGLALELANSNSGPISDAIKSLIDSFCNQSHLQSATFTGSDEGVFGSWLFVGGDILNGSWIQSEIPGLPAAFPLSGGVTDIGINFAGHNIQQSDNLNFGYPRPNSTNAQGTKSMADIMANGNTWGANPENPVSEKDLNALFTAANPRLSHPKNTDCLSCHLNHQYMGRLNQLDIKDITSRFKTPFGITGFAQIGTARSTGTDVEGSIVRVFGYESNKPVAEPIVANSSAMVAEQVNSLYKWDPPTQRDCSAPEVYACFYDLDQFAPSFLDLDKYSMDQKQKHEAECLAKCQTP